MKRNRKFRRWQESPSHTAGLWPEIFEEAFKILDATLSSHGLRTIKTNRTGVIDVYKAHPYPCGHIHIRENAKLHVDFGAYESEDAQLPIARHIDLDLHNPRSIAMLLAAMNGANKFDGKMLGKNDTQTFHSRVSFE